MSAPRSWRVGKPRARRRPPRATAGPDRLLTATVYDVRADEALRSRVEEKATAAIAGHCSRCHGPDLGGETGVPNLVDEEWIWGVTGEEMSEVEPVLAIEQTILYGVRNVDCPDIREQSRYAGCADTRYSEMPAYSVVGFTDQRIDDLVEYTLHLAGEEADDAAVERATNDYALVCSECHGEDGWGYTLFGEPSLRDDVTLYGNDRETIRDVLANGRLGRCPPRVDAIDARTIKALALHIWGRSQGS